MPFTNSVLRASKCRFALIPDFPFSEAEYQRRYQRVSESVRDLRIDALLVRNLEDICYLTGYENTLNIAYHCLILSNDEPILVLRRYEEANVEASSWLSQIVTVEDHENLAQVVATTLTRIGAGRRRVAATHLLMASKKGMSALQVGRMLGLSKKTAWFVCHRIRESLRGTDLDPLGGQNKVVEADETYIGGKAKNRKGKTPPKEAAFALVERDGKVRSFHVASVSAKTLRPILVSQVSRKSYLMTDDAPRYVKMGEEFAGHGSVNHSIEEYVRGYFWHTNTVENYFSILKRGITGTYHHVSQQYLKRYLAEFDFRYNERQALGVNDAERMSKSIGGIVGKRLTYRRPRGRANV